MRVGDGIHRVPFYFYNPNGRVGPDNWRRDYFIEIRREMSNESAAEMFSVEKRLKGDMSNQKRTKILSRKTALAIQARSRVRYFAGTGVYKSFIITTLGIYYVRVVRNNSLNTILNGVFMSNLNKDREKPYGFGHGEMNMPFFLSMAPCYMQGRSNCPFPYFNYKDATDYTGKNIASSSYRMSLLFSLSGHDKQADPLLALSLGYRNQTMISKFDLYLKKLFSEYQRICIPLLSSLWAKYSPNTVPFSVEELKAMEAMKIDWQDYLLGHTPKVPVEELNKMIKQTNRQKTHEN